MQKARQPLPFSKPVTFRGNVSEGAEFASCFRKICVPLAAGVHRGDSHSAWKATATVVKFVPVLTTTPDPYATLNE